jgi:hypothetical protein
MEAPAPVQGQGADRQNDRPRKGVSGHPRQQLVDIAGLPLSPCPRKGVPGAPLRATSGWCGRYLADGSAA